MKLNIGLLEVIVLVLITVVGWAISLEVRLANATDYNSRLKNLEELMLPIMVDWKVRKEMEKAGHMSGYFEHVGCPIPEPAYPAPMPPPDVVGGDPAPEPDKPPVDVPQVEQDAEDWAQEMIQRPHMKK